MYCEYTKNTPLGYFWHGSGGCPLSTINDFFKSCHSISRNSFSVLFMAICWGEEPMRHLQSGRLVEVRIFSVTPAPDGACCQSASCPAVYRLPCAVCLPACLPPSLYDSTSCFCSKLAGCGIWLLAAAFLIFRTSFSSFCKVGNPDSYMKFLIP